MVGLDGVASRGAEMNNAVWLFQALPIWYFSTIVHPLSAGPLTAVPALGIISLVVGLTLGLSGREPRLLLFLIPFAFSQLFVAIAGALRGCLAGASSGPPLLLFILVQVVLVGYLIYRLAGARGAAVALAAFSLTYALFADFVASMSFSNDWL